MQASYAPKVIPVEIEEDKKKKIIEKLVKEFDEALDSRSGLDKKRETWLKQYNSRLVDPSSDEEIQLDIPTTHEFLGQQCARILNPIFSQPTVFIASPRYPSEDKRARALSKALDFVTDKTRLLTVCKQWLSQAQVFGIGIVKVLFVSKKCKIMDWEQQVDVDEMGMPTIQQVESERWIVTKQGPEVGVVPVSDFVYPARAQNVQSCKWVCHRLYLDDRDIKDGIREGAYAKDALEKIGDASDTLNTLAQNERKMLGVDVSSDKTHEILEFWAAVDVDDDGYDEEVVITVHRKSKQDLRFVHNWLHGSYRRPFVTCQVEDGNIGLTGISATYRLEPLHRAYSLSTMQRLNAAAKANEVLVLAPYGSDIENIFKDGKIKGGFYQITGDINSIKQFNLSQPFSQSEQLEQQIMGHMERDIAINEILFGATTVDRESATGFMKRMEESQQPLFLLLETFRLSLAEVGIQMLSRVKQHYPEGMEVYLQSEPNGELIAEFVQWPEGALEDAAIIEVTASSSTVNKNIRRQEKMAIMDKWPSILNQKMQLAMAGAQPGPQSMIAIKMMQGFDVLVRDFLEEMEIPNAELVNPDLTQDLLMAQQMQMQMLQAQAAGQVQPGNPQGGPGAPGLPPGAPPAGPPPQGAGGGPQGPPPGPIQG